MHMVLVNRWPRFPDGTRWDNELTRYEEIIDRVGPVDRLIALSEFTLEIAARVREDLAFARSVGYLVMLKPVDGAASIGVHPVPDEATLAALSPTVDPARYEIEEFVTGPIHHVDGFVGPHPEIQFRLRTTPFHLELFVPPGDDLVFLLGESQQQLEADIQRIIRDFDFKAVPL